MNRHGFSRLEAILVFSVAALLAAALFPIVAHRRAVQRDELCRTNLKLTALCMKQYLQDYEKYPPLVIDQNATSPTPRTKGINWYVAFGWADALDIYAHANHLNALPLLCPLEQHLNLNSPAHLGYTDYWFNRNLAGRYEASVDYIAQVLLFGDGDGASPNSNARYVINALPKSWVSTPGSPARRHFDGANYAFADGHVKWLRPQQISNARPDKKHPVNTFAID